MFLKCFGSSTCSSKRPYPSVIQELCHQFSLADLSKSTNDFDDQNCRIGDGEFSEVYKGYLQHYVASGYTVAVKRFRNDYLQNRCVELFKNEVELLCQLRHPNIMSLIGFCDHKKEKIIVYEYMSNGSLDQHLPRGELSWKKRLEICIGAARGLHYLHAGAKRTIIHRNIKPSNILLDDHMEPKLGGFALNIQGPRSISMPKPIKADVLDVLAGTRGYLAPECFSENTVSDKADVFSFGWVLLHVVFGINYFNPGKWKFLIKPVEESIDENIKGKIAPECWQVFIDITQRCVKYEADERPTMGEVEVELEHALSLQEQADITNTDGHYHTLLSTTIIRWKQDEELQTNTQDSDTEDTEEM